MVRTRIKWAWLVAITVIIFACVLARPAYAEEVKVDNGIPVVYLTIDESKGTIDAMNKSEDHSVKCYGTVSIDVPDGFHYTDMPEALCEDLPEIAMEMRGRGNTTWGAAKKPYKIKLDEERDIFGLGANKHWVLIANAYDKTLMKDRITAWLGDEIGMEFTPRGEPVDLVMRNTDGTFSKYLGSYYFSENVRVDQNRIEIDKIGKKDTDPDSLEITGGYLIQNSAQIDAKSPNVFTTNRNEGWANHTPSFDPADGGYENEAQKKYIRDFVQKFEDALFSGDFEGEKGTSYRDLMDIEAAANYWLVNTFCDNGDGYSTGSTYIYKRRDTEVDGVRKIGKLSYGPLWDFDFAWYYEMESDNLYLRNDWVRAMMTDIGDDGFVDTVQRNWYKFRKAIKKLYVDGGMIDRYYEEVKASQAQDYITNPYGKNDEATGGDAYEGYDIDPEPTEYVYKDEVEKLKDWIKRRLESMDQYIYKLDGLVHTVNYYVDGVHVKRAVCEDGHFVEQFTDVPDKEGYTFVGWTTEDGKMADLDSDLFSDIDLYAKYVQDSKVSHVKELYFLLDKDYIDFTDEVAEGMYPVKYTVYPAGAVDKRVIFTSSDEDIATVDRTGIVKFKKPGTVTITGTLKYNKTVSKSMVLTALEGPVKEAKKLTLAKSTMNMKKGEHAQIRFKIAPEDSAFDFFEFKSNHEDIASVDEAGVVTAKKGGTVTITVTGNLTSETSQSRYITAKCKVVIPREKNTVKVTAKKIKVKSKTLSKKKVKLARKKVVKIKGAKGKLTYKLKSVTKKKFKKYFSLNKKTGKLTIKKGLKKGTYKLKIRVTDSGGLSYKKAVKTVKVRVKVR